MNKKYTRRKQWGTKNMPKKSKNDSGDKPRKAKSKEKGERTREALSRLEVRLFELQGLLQQAAQEREQLYELLQQAAQERASLQSQLEWVLYRLEQLNPEQTQYTLWRLEEWLSGGQSQSYLSSEVGVDYSHLQNLLAKGKWRKADEETWGAMLRVAGREEEGWLTVEDMQNFPSADLRTIDTLWEQHSNARFGLSVQLRIWESAGGDYTNFCDCVGWRVTGNWKYYDDLSFSIEAPEGHLPVIGWRRRACYGVGKSTASESFNLLRAKFATQ
jgi:hypothetical protein